MRTSLKITLALILSFAGASVHAQEVDGPSADNKDLINVVDTNAPIEIIEERYEDGKIKIRREVTLDLAGNYIKHGQWESFSYTGDQLASGAFKNNKRDGVWTRVINWGEAELLNELPYPEFQAPFVSRAEFENGQLNGEWTITDNEGRVASRWIYRDGKLHGTAKWFFPDGQVREQIDYVDGLVDGTYRLLDQDGVELTNETYEEGRKLAVKQELYPSGVVKWEGMFLHETHVVKQADDWWNTRPVSYEKIGSPERHGRFTSWYENGQKKFEGLFEHETRAGEFTWWHENTQQAVQGSFQDDQREGVWVWWHENGQKAIQGRYKDGKLDGKWSYWNANGRLERKIDYTNGSEPVAVHAVPSTDVPRVADQGSARTENALR